MNILARWIMWLSTLHLGVRDANSYLIIFQSFVKLNEKGDRSGVFEISQLIGMKCIK